MENEWLLIVIMNQNGVVHQFIGKKLAVSFEFTLEISTRFEQNNVKVNR